MFFEDFYSNKDGLIRDIVIGITDKLKVSLFFGLLAVRRYYIIEAEPFECGLDLTVRYVCKHVYVTAGYGGKYSKRACIREAIMLHFYIVFYIKYTYL